MLRSQYLGDQVRRDPGELSELAGLDSLEEDQRTELKEKTAELRQVEEQRVAALEVEALEEAQEKSTNGTSPLDPEERERREVLGKARLGNAIRAVIDGRPLQGAESELRSAYGLSGDHEVPHELFEPRAATPAPATGPVNEAPVQPYLYKETVAGYLGIDMHQAGSGTPSFPVLTTGTPAAMKVKGAAADETAGAFTVVTSSPKRVTGAFRVRVEDMAVFPQLEDSLRRDIPQSLANAVEEQLLNGDGQAPNIRGLLKRLTDPDAEAAKNKAATYVSTVVGALDGLHGYSLGDLKTLAGKATYQAMAGAFFDKTAVSAASYLDSNTGGVRMTDRLPAVASDVQAGIVRVGMRPWCAVSALWGGVSLIRDIYSDAGKGEIIVTALQLISDVHVLRSGAFAQVSFKP